MSPKMGRPSSENPKDQRLQIRVDKDTVANIDHCVKVLNTNRSEIVRMGVDLIKEKVDGHK